MENYKTQKACSNCKYCLDVEDDCFCNRDESIPTVGNLLGPNDFSKDSFVKALQIDIWEKWKTNHSVSRAGICDNYEAE